MTIVVLQDIEARAQAETFKWRIAELHPSSIHIDFGTSGLGRSMLALPVVDALAKEFPKATLSVVGSRIVRRIVTGHIDATSGRPCAHHPPELIVDLRPAVRRGASWEDGSPARLKVSSAPFPRRWQHAAAHWLDGARSAGLDPVSAAPRLGLPRHAIPSARRLLSGLGKRAPLVLLAPRAGGWDSALLRETGAQLERRIGAVVRSLAPCEGVDALRTRDPIVLAACCRLACVVIGDNGGWCDVAAAANGAVVAVHGRASPTRHGPASELGAAVYADCRQPLVHRPSETRGGRCLRCLDVTPVVEMAEKLAALRWPWDRLERWGLVVS